MTVIELKNEISHLQKSEYNALTSWWIDLDRTKDDFAISDEHKKILDFRLKNMNNQQPDGASWEEVKSNIINRPR